MIRVRLREAMRRHEAKAGTRVTYAWLAAKTGLAKATLEAIGSRGKYNPTLSTVERLCTALCCSPADLLELRPPSTRPKRHRI